MKRIVYSLSIALAFNASQAMQKDDDQYSSHSSNSSKRHFYKYDDDNSNRQKANGKDDSRKISRISRDQSAPYQTKNRDLYPRVTFQTSCDGRPISEEESDANALLKVMFDGRTTVSGVFKKIILRQNSRLIYNCAKALRHVESIRNGDEWSQFRNTTGGDILYDKQLLQLSEDLLIYVKEQHLIGNLDHYNDFDWDYQLQQTRHHLDMVEKNLSLFSVGALNAQKAKEAKRIERDRADIQLMRDYTLGKALIEDEKFDELKRTAKFGIKEYEGEDNDKDLRQKRLDLEKEFKKLFLEVKSLRTLKQSPATN